MSKQYTREEIYTKLLEILVEDFEISKDIITPNANLFEDLELDSDNGQIPKFRALYHNSLKVLSMCM